MTGSGIGVPAKWQAARWPSPLCSSGGSTSAQIGCASGQRVRNRQPLGGFIGLGTTAQVIGHVTFSLSWVVLIVRGRLVMIGRDVEEAAADDILRLVAGVLEPADRLRIRQQAQGNPLALLELPASWAGSAPPADWQQPTLSARLERAFAGRLAELPAATRDALRRLSQWLGS